MTDANITSKLFARHILGKSWLEHVQCLHLTKKYNSLTRNSFKTKRILLLLILNTK